MINFPKKITINACEKFISDVKEGGQNVPILFPIGVSSYAFGGLATAIQAVNSWARSDKSRVIFLRSSDSKNALDELINRPHKFVAAMFSKVIALENTPEDNLRKDVNLAARNAIENQSSSEFGQQRGGLCWFGFVDHSSKGFDRNFYIRKSDSMPEPRQVAQFQSVINSMIDKTLSVTGGSKSLEVNDLDHLGRIFYELFINTHEHGTRSEKRSDWLKSGVRIIYVQSINLTKKGAQGITDNQPILSEYIDSIEDKKECEDNRKFIEISIIDSGLGYCNRWLSDHQTEDSHQNISIAKEYDIFKKCFTFRQTSTNKDSKGNGLPVVMNKLTKLDGFMRVRSGRLSLCRDFVKFPYVLDDTFAFSDWESGLSAGDTLTPMASATGVAITLLIPLEAK